MEAETEEELPEGEDWQHNRNGTGSVAGPLVTVLK
jgi:hypothetical protein